MNNEWGYGRFKSKLSNATQLQNGIADIWSCQRRRNKATFRQVVRWKI